MEWQEEEKGGFATYLRGERVARVYPVDGGWDWYVSLSGFYAEGEVKTEKDAIEQADTALDMLMKFRRGAR